MKLSMPAAESTREIARQLESCRAILDGISDPVFQHDRNLRLIYANRAYLRAAGVTEAAAMGRLYWELFPRLGRPLAGCPCAMEGHLSERFEEQFTFEERVYRSRGYPLLQDGPALASGIHILVDVTEAYRAEQERARLAEAFEREHHARRERVKELHCLHALSALAATPGIQFEQILEALPELLAAAYQYPEVAVARVVLEEHGTASPGFRETAWIQAVAVIREGRVLGRLEVAYLEPRPEADEGPFLREERQLLETVAWRIGTLLHDQRVRAALAESEERYRRLVEDAPDAIVVTDLETGTLLDVNRRAEALTGQPREALVGRNFTVLHPGDDGFDYQAIFCAAALTREKSGGWFHHLNIQRADGARVPVEIRSSIHSRDGRRVLVAFIRDMTDRRAAEQAAQRSRERFELAVRAAGEGIWEWDFREREFFYSARVSELLGYAHGTLVPRIRTVRELAHPADLRKLVKRLHAHLRRRERYEVECRFLTESGEYRWFLCRGKAVWDQQGRALRMAGSLSDITDRKRVEAALRESEVRYRNLYETMEQGVVYQNRHGRIIDANPAAQRILGLSLEQMLGRTSLDPHWQAIRADGTDLPGEEHPSMLALRNARPVSGIMGIHNARDGQLRWILMSAMPVNQAGHTGPHQVFTTFSDITELKKTAEDLAVRNRAVEASRNGIAIIDAQRPERPIIYVNPGLCEIFGHAATHLMGQPARVLWSGALDGEAERIVAAMAGYHTVDAVIEIRRPDKRRVWAEFRIAPVRDSGGIVTHFVAVVNDISERRRYESQLEFQAQHDAMTGLPNRNLMQDRLRQAIVYAKRHNTHVGVLFLDVDQFKVINDGLGHEAGDLLLMSLAARLRENAREEDTIARYGGDEFVLLLPDLGSEDDISRIAGRLFEAMSAPFAVGNQEIHVTFSVGASTYPKDGHDPAVLLRNADTAMYRAKEAGRNNLQFYTEEQNARMVERLMLGGQLRGALERGELLLHFQPQIDLRSGRICGAEALLRWVHPELGMISPMRFVPIAEETGLIVPIGEWVLEQACAQAVAWRKAGLPPLTVAVNLSVRQLEQPGLVERVAGVLGRTGLEPAALELEVTESAVMRRPEQTAQCLEALKGLGVVLSLDDFGTGYSSLSYLRRFAFDRLKIDRSFIRDITTEPNAARIALTIIAMSQSLGMRVIAEGVETAAQAHFLRRHACDEVQGYFMSVPLPAEELEKFARSGFMLDVGGAEPEARTLLLVDDEPNIIRALQRTLRRDGYHILVANSPAEALELLACHEVQVIVSDQRMPSMTGTELLTRVKEIYPDIVRIVLSGYTELKTITDSVNRGAVYKFLTKPWEEEPLRAEIAEAFRYHDRRRIRQSEPRE